MRVLLAFVLLLSASCGAARRADPMVTSTPSATASSPVPTEQGTSRCVNEGGDDEFRMFINDVVVTSESVTFRFEPPEGEPAGMPFYRVSTVTPPLTESATGDELDVEGEAFVRATIYASGVDLGTDGVREVYTGPEEFAPEGDGPIVAVREGGDYEATSNWYVGLDAEACPNIRATDEFLTLSFG